MSKFQVTKKLKCTRFITYELEAEDEDIALEALRGEGYAPYLCLDEYIVSDVTEMDGDPMDEYEVVALDTE